MSPYPIINAWRKRHYVARVTGRHDKFVFDREFLQGRPIKSRGVVAYELRDIGTVPAWIIRADDTGAREVIAAHELGWESMGALDSHGILSVFEAGPPGHPDAWTGERCLECHESPVFGDGPTRCGECDAGAHGRAAAMAMSGANVDPF